MLETIETLLWLSFSPAGVLLWLIVGSLAIWFAGTVITATRR